MQHALAIALSSVFVLQAAPLMAASGPGAARAGSNQASVATGSITGTVQTAAGQTLPNYRVQVRDLQTGKVAASGTSSAEGSFSFADLPIASYAVEVGPRAGEIVSVNTATPSAARGIRMTVAVPAAPASAGNASGITRAAEVTSAAAAARIVAVAAPSGRPSASPSR